MQIKQLAKLADLRILTSPNSEEVMVNRVYAGDRMSDLLSNVSDTTLLVTNLTNTALIRLIELMDAPGICLLHDKDPEEVLITTAQRCGTTLLLSPAGLFETCGRLYVALGLPQRDMTA